MTSPIAAIAAPKEPLPDRNIINEGDHVLVEMPSGNARMVQMKLDVVVALGKYGKFKTNDVIGKPYGYTYESKNNVAVVLQTDIDVFAEVDEGDGLANNREINDEGQTQQVLTYDQIEEMKKAGEANIIQQVVNGNVHFDKKTPYAQAKYIRRKQQKFGKRFRILQINTYNLNRHFYMIKNREKIRFLRMDTLAQMMTLSNVRPGARILTVDDSHGMLTCAMLDRLGGQGCIFNIHDTEAPKIDLLKLMNPTADTLASLKTLSWSRVVKEGGEPKFERKDESTIPANKMKNYLRKKNAADKVESLQEELASGNFDALVITTTLDVKSVLDELLPYVGGSAPIVIFEPVLEHLVPVFGYLRSSHEFINVQITESFMREYQVLPGRTHPEMTTTGGGGYILQATRVFDNPEAHASTFRPKIESNEKVATNTGRLQSSKRPSPDHDTVPDAEPAQKKVRI